MPTGGPLIKVRLAGYGLTILAGGEYADCRAGADSPATSGTWSDIVSKKKGGKALFEVLGLGSEKSKKVLGVPGWFGPSGLAQPTPRESRAAGAPPTAPMLAAPAAPGAPAVTAESPEPILSISAGRLRISLNWVSTVVACVGLIALLLAAYRLGRYSLRRAAPPPSANTGGGVRRSGVAPVPGPRTPAGLPDAGQPQMVPDDAPRTKGYWYIVIQGGIATAEEAQDIKRFLYKKGINATRHRSGETGEWKVKDLRAFKDRRDRTARREITERVEQFERLGRAYLASGGRYDFRQKQKDDPWMEPAK